ncbi:oligopeptide transporter [Aspergillus nomiae NRRL 13137]|uniref:Oligopeptide transporter n=1 Tax=Aspergillus nomiae NRRL (strain ATCC 15546 / NRRL 13137 / CBS 260.88 / M93) TaxID=1509407 RepID=A0A0L1JF15_ASPN3|nr:oligopeptide transporter [Aspergillus nomiae NRRL 13137]KNG89938.1 oligopeptide transporter [Aspergillus nomiae NRRL 13137]
MAPQGTIESNSLSEGKKAAVTISDEEKASPSATEPVYDGDQYLGQAPTEEELNTLRKVPGPISGSGYWLCTVEFAERASYYGCTWVFQNFIQYPLPPGGNGAGASAPGSEKPAGALGQGLQVSSALTLLFKFLAYCIPIFGGWLADTKLGRYKTICIGVAICGVSHIIMVVGAIPSILQAGHGMAPFVVSLIILAFGAGMIKANISPVVMEQVTFKHPYIRTLKSGERVIVHPETTIQRLTLTFYGLINVGAFFGLATSYSAKRVGYWLAYLIPGIMYFLMPVILALVYKKTIKMPPQGNVLGDTWHVIKLAIQQNGFRKFGSEVYFNSVKPSELARQGIASYKGRPISWNDGFVDDVRRTLVACQIFLFYPLYYLNNGGIGSITNSQAGSMTTKGAPNDLVSNFNPLAIIIASPILNYGLYPLLRRHRIEFGPIKRITLGFILAALSCVIGAILQWRVYETSPCGYYATECDIGDGVSTLSVWAQTPMYVLQALSELFAIVSGYELAFSRSPKSMRALVVALFLFTSAVSSAISQAVVPALADPHLIWPFVGTAVPGVIFAVVFYWIYRGLDKETFLRDDSDGQQEILSEKDKN